MQIQHCCLAALCLALAPAALAAEVNLLALGDWGAPPGGNSVARQTAVEKAMEKYVTDHQLKVDAVLMLGDNFYEDLQPGDNARMDEIFEKRYPAAFYKDTPFYVVMGNHDCETEGNSHLNTGKVKAELGYASRQGSRFKILSAGAANEWERTRYRVDFPGAAADKPFATLLALDSNWHYLGPIKCKDKDGHPSDGWKQENAWLRAQLTASQAQPHWVLCMAHFPVFSNGCHQQGQDGKVIRRDWLSIFQDEAGHVRPPDFYLCGHNHDLEHIEKRDEVSTSFITDGGGGGDHTYPLRTDTLKPFSRRLYGFTHLRLLDDHAEVTLLGSKDTGSSSVFTVVHAFTRDLATGKVTLTATPAPQIDAADPGHCTDD